MYMWTSLYGKPLHSCILHTNSTPSFGDSVTDGEVELLRSGKLVCTSFGGGLRMDLPSLLIAEADVVVGANHHPLLGAPSRVP